MQLKMLVYIAATNVILHWIQNSYGNRRKNILQGVSYFMRNVMLGNICDS